MQVSFNNQLERLYSAGCPWSVVVAVAETLLKKVKAGTDKDGAGTLHGKEMPQVMSYMHKVAHGLKKVANRHNLPVVFSAPRKLVELGRLISGGTKKPRCYKRHGKRFVECAMGAVYEIPLLCGKSYMGQTGRCVNGRLRVHAKDLENDHGANLVERCGACKDCTPRFPDVKIISKSRLQTTRETIEAYYITNAGPRCVSDTSLVLYSAENKCISQFLR